MGVLVDTVVILDVLTGDRDWVDWSQGQLDLHRTSGLVVNAIVYSELCAMGSDSAEVEEILGEMQLVVEEIPRAALLSAARVFLDYRESGGERVSPLPQFLIGAHAEAEGLAILTRDAVRYREYFPTVRLIEPQTEES